MRAFLMITLVCMATVSELALARSNSLSHEWSLYKRQHGKNYANQEEEAARFANFMAAKARVERHNADATSSYKLDLNHMSDWSQEDLAKLKGLKVDAADLDALGSQMSIEQEAELQAHLSKFDSTPVPDSVDWRQVEGRVSRVKDQGACGSCWAFATTGLLEGQQVARNITKKLDPLSEQDLLDCSERDNGCGGGAMWFALDDLKNLGGIEDEAAYPYVAFKHNQCEFDKKKSIMSVVGSNRLKVKSEEELKRVVASYGPVAVGIYASDDFTHYKRGIWAEQDCQWAKVNGLNHAVLIVGYGTDPKEGDYWIVKNSWTESWGEQGYFRIKRGVDMCGISKVPTIATF